MVWWYFKIPYHSENEDKHWFIIVRCSTRFPSRPLAVCLLQLSPQVFENWQSLGSLASWVITEYFISNNKTLSFNSRRQQSVALTVQEFQPITVLHFQRLVSRGIIVHILMDLTVFWCLWSAVTLKEISLDLFMAGCCFWCCSCLFYILSYYNKETTADYFSLCRVTHQTWRWGVDVPKLTVLLLVNSRAAAAVSVGLPVLQSFQSPSRPVRCWTLNLQPPSGSQCCAVRPRRVRHHSLWSSCTTRPSQQVPMMPSWWPDISWCSRLGSLLRWGEGDRLISCWVNRWRQTLWVSVCASTGHRAEARWDACWMEVCRWSLQAAVHSSSVWEQPGLGGGCVHGPNARHEQWVLFKWAEFIFLWPFSVQLPLCFWPFSSSCSDSEGYRNGRHCPQTMSECIQLRDQWVAR